MAEKEDQDPLESPSMTLATPKKCSGCITDKWTALHCSRASSPRFCHCLLGLGLHLMCSLGFSFLFDIDPVHLIEQAQSCFLLSWRSPTIWIQSGSKVRNKDQRDPMEKRFPSSVLFIIPPLLLPQKALPFSTVAPLCVLGHSILPCTFKELFLGNRGVCRESEYKCVCRERSVLWLKVCIYSRR